MRVQLHRSAGSVVSALALATLLFGAATSANAADAPQSGSTAPTGAVAARPVVPVNRVEAQIKSLHKQLQITSAQEPQWTAVAQVMRDNAKSVSSLIRERAQKANSMTAPDDLRAYQTIADAHAAGIKALIPAFDALYATMSDEQKKNADAVFHRQQRRQGRHAPAKQG